MSNTRPDPHPTVEDPEGLSTFEKGEEQKGAAEPEVTVSKQEFSFIDVGREPNKLVGGMSLQSSSTGTTTATGSQVRPDPVAPTAPEMLEAKIKAKDRKAKAKALERRRERERAQRPPVGTAKQEGRKEFPTEKFCPHQLSPTATPGPVHYEGATTEDNDENETKSSSDKEDTTTNHLADERATYNPLLIEASLITNQPNQASTISLNTGCNSQGENSQEDIAQAEVVVPQEDKNDALSGGCTDSMDHDSKCLDERGFKLAIFGLITIIILAVIIVIGVAVTSNNTVPDPSITTTTEQTFPSKSPSRLGTTTMASHTQQPTAYPSSAPTVVELPTEHPTPKSVGR